MTKDAGERIPWWGYLLIAALLAPSLLWIAEDYHVWPWDQAWYGEVSVDLRYWLTHSPYQWLATMADGLNLKPPGVVWIGQFFVALNGITGSSERSLLFSVMVTQFVLLVFVYKIGQALSPNSRLVPFGGMLFAGSGQLLAGLSRQLFVEPLQAVTVAWTLLAVIKAAHWSRSRTAVHLVGSLTLGLLAKATTPLYVLLPCLYCLFVWIRRPANVSFAAEWKSLIFRVLTVAVAGSAFAGALWYSRHLSDVWRHVRDATSGDVALNYATPGSATDRFLIWIHLVQQSFLSAWLVWAIAPALAIAAIWKWKMFHEVLPQAITVVSILQIALLLWVFSVNTTVDPRYMYAILPFLAILFMQICAVLPPPAFFALLAICVWQWGMVCRASLGASNLLADQCRWLYPPQRDRTQFDELTRVVRFTSNIPERYNILGVEEPHINANSASFFSSKNRLITGVRNYYTSLGYAEKDPAAAMRRIEEFHAHYVITLTEAAQAKPPDFLNVTTLPILQRMQRDARFIPQGFPSQTGILVFEFKPPSESH